MRSEETLGPVPLKDEEADDEKNIGNKESVEASQNSYVICWVFASFTSYFISFVQDDDYYLRQHKIIIKYYFKSLLYSPISVFFLLS